MNHSPGRLVVAGQLVLCILVALAAALGTAWASFALWYRLPAPDWTRGLAAAAFVVLGVATAVSALRRRHLAVLGVFGLAFCATLIWWATIKPPDRSDWAPDVGRQVTGSVAGDMLTLMNIRDFEWRGNTEFTEHWVTRSYDLTKLRTLDLFMSYWAGPEMAHVILSFGFEGGEYLAWSVEVRRRADGEFSPLADLFKSNPLIIIASDERDVVRVRSNIRGEDVQLYRLRTAPAAARRLLLEYVADANGIAAAPEFYNSLTTNCTTTVVKMMRAVGAKVPLDWRLIVNGYLPGFLHDQGAVDTRLSLAELRTRAHIDGRAREAAQSPDFSRLIRVGVPSPLAPIYAN